MRPNSSSLIRVVDQAVTIDQACTATGWEKLSEIAETSAPNRILIGACLPYLYISKLKELGRRINLDSALMDVVDIMKEAQSSKLKAESNEHPASSNQ